MNNKTSLVLTLASILILGVALYLLDPSVYKNLGLSKKEGFTEHDTKEKGKMSESRSSQNPAVGHKDGEEIKKELDRNESMTKEGFVDSGPADFPEPLPPAGCYPKDQLTPAELLPADQDSVWAQQNPMGPGSLKGKNFLSAGALIGVNTVGQSLRNANLQLRSEPPNPQASVSIFNQTTIAPDMNRRPLEIGA